MLRILFYCLIVYVGLVHCEKGIRFANCDCSVNKEYLNLTKCNLKAYSREKVLANVDFFLLKNVTNCTMHFSVFKATSTGRYFPYLFDYWGNFCAMVKEGSNINFILKQTKRIMAKFSNSMKCFHKVKTTFLKKKKTFYKTFFFKADFYYFRNVEIEYRLLKFFLENGRYRMHIDFYEAIRMDLITLGNYTAHFFVNDIQTKRGKNNKNS